MVELFRIASSLRLANEVKWLLIGSNPVQSWRSFVLVYLGLFITTRRAMFWSSCSFSMWTSAALTKHMLGYSKMGRIIAW